MKSSVIDAEDREIKQKNLTAKIRRSVILCIGPEQRCVFPWSRDMKAGFSPTEECPAIKLRSDWNNQAWP
ncbi:hypothetical protein RRG08_000709 [Elysia crispata]|uniref:Uncharacterized protein n=1 Tax=Elysia crispata TaxID=231223 RepID=A0AAE1AWN2_9GAST|nr:hypothetical protein RRG08_000709 [Elysia crispata]